MMRVKPMQGNSAKGQPKTESPKTGKKFSAGAGASAADGGCPIVAPPDPKMLPKPTGFFNSSNAKNGPGHHKPKQDVPTQQTGPSQVPMPVQHFAQVLHL